MPAANYEPEMRIDKLANRIEDLKIALTFAKEALQHCVVDPAPISPHAKSAAMNAIDGIDEVLRGGA